MDLVEVQHGRNQPRGYLPAVTCLHRIDRQKQWQQGAVPLVSYQVMFFPSQGARERCHRHFPILR